MPYYYLILHPGHAVELNRCVHDNMCSNPKETDIRKGETEPLCYTGERECEDCRERPVEDIYSAHFTVCQKPWKCIRPALSKGPRRLCRSLHNAWFGLRSEMERAWGRSGFGNSTWRDGANFFGYCHKAGTAGYEPIRAPFLDVAKL